MQNLDKIIKDITNINGRCFFVGGYVRDFLLHKKAYDYDIEVYNINFEKLVEVLKNYGEVEGFKKFGIARIKNYSNYEFALPRTEEKSGNSYCDFNINTDINLNMYDASIRRDFTINALYMDCVTREVFDYHNSITDLNNQEIRHVSDKFVEDPLRVIRAIRFSAKLGFTINSYTLMLCKKMICNLKYISNERFTKEFSLIMSYDYLNVANKYIELLLFPYFNITNHLNVAYYDTKNLDLRVVLFFYNIKDNDLSKCLCTLVNKKSLLSKINFVTNTSLTNYYEYFNFFDELAIDIYRIINGECVVSKYQRYLVLKSKYNGEYFLEKNVDKTKIKSMIELSIKKEL